MRLMPTATCHEINGNVVVSVITEKRTSSKMKLVPAAIDHEVYGKHGGISI